jgi:peptide/nickel transport system ATP-binding protein
MRAMDNLLDIRDLKVEYRTEGDVVYAVNGLSLSLGYGETMGLVGETGAGKTTTAMSIMRILPARIGFVTGGKILLDGVDVMAISEKEMRTHRGNTVSMIFQDPMSSLNPVMTVGDQILEVLKIHKRNRGRHHGDGGHPRLPEVGIPASVLRRHEAAHRDRHRAGVRAQAHFGGRADHRAGRDDPGADAGDDQRA